MKYALPLTNGKVSAHFGHSEQFAVFEIDPATKQIIKRELATPPPHEPGVLPAWLAEMGVSVIITGGIGSRARELFGRQNITVVAGVAEEDPGQAVKSYLNDTLETGDNSCDHGPNHQPCGH